MNPAYDPLCATGTGLDHVYSYRAATAGEIHPRRLHPADGRQRLAALGAEPVTLSPEQFGTAVVKETAKWAKVIRDSRARPE